MEMGMAQGAIFLTLVLVLGLCIMQVLKRGDGCPCHDGKKIGLVGRLGSHFLEPCARENDAAGPRRGDFKSVYKNQSVDDLVMAFMARHGVPGVAVAIVQAPYITRVTGYGLAGTEAKQLVGSHTAFSIGQMTNAFTAVAIMQLVEAGKLALADQVGKFFPQISKACAVPTVRTLLIHASGLPDFRSLANYSAEQSGSVADIVGLFAGAELLFEPGTRVQYSASNYQLLGLIIEKVSGVSYEQFVSENQFKRAGLVATYFGSTLDSIKNERATAFKHKQFLHDVAYIDPIEVATGCQSDGAAQASLPLPSWQSTFADSGIYSSAEDISRWDIALAGDIFLKDPASHAFLYGPAELNDGSKVPSSTGWFFAGHPGLMHLKGITPGYSTILVRFTAPDESLCVTILTNKGGLQNLDLLARDIAAAYDARLGAPSGADWSVLIQSPFSVEETIDRVAKTVQSHGGTIFARVNHSEAATKAGLSLRPTQVLMLGNPKVGTKLMVADAAIAMDLPLKVMAYQEESGQVWLSFTDPVALTRHYGDTGAAETAHKIYGALLGVCQEAMGNYLSPQAK